MTLRYPENVGTNLVTILVWFYVGGYGTVLLPIEVHSLKSTVTRERFRKLHERSTGSERKKKRGNWSGKGLVVMWPGRKWRALNFVTAHIQNLGSSSNLLASRDWYEASPVLRTQKYWSHLRRFGSPGSLARDSWTLERAPSVCARTDYLKVL
jgi:hypothetical protein